MNAFTVKPSRGSNAKTSPSWPNYWTGWRKLKASIQPLMSAPSTSTTAEPIIVGPRQESKDNIRQRQFTFRTFPTTLMKKSHRPVHKRRESTLVDGLSTSQIQRIFVHLANNDVLSSVCRKSTWNHSLEIPKLGRTSSPTFVIWSTSMRI